MGTTLPQSPPMGGDSPLREGAEISEVPTMYYDHKNIEFARKLRKEMTPWERKLWYCFLKEYPLRFQRQKAIGHYIADFYCAKANLIIELDGGGHYHPQAQEKDQLRTAQLEAHGIKVLRFCNLNVDKNFYGVCTVIDNEAKQRSQNK